MTDPYTPPPGAVRKAARQSLAMIRADAKQAALDLGKVEGLDPALGDIIFKMNGREAVLGLLLSEADDRIAKLEMEVGILLQTASRLIDEVSELRGLIAKLEEGVDGASEA